MRGQTQKQSDKAAGEVPSAGNKPGEKRRRGLNHRPGGDGGGVDSPAVRGAGTAAALGPAGYGRGRCLTALDPGALTVKELTKSCYIQ